MKKKRVREIERVVVKKNSERAEKESKHSSEGRRERERESSETV